MNTINSNNGAAYAMKAPDIAADAGKTIETLFPTAEEIYLVSAKGDVTIDIVRDKTVVFLEKLGGDVILTLNKAARLNPCATVAVVTYGNPCTVTIKVHNGETIRIANDKDNPFASSVLHVREDGELLPLAVWNPAGSGSGSNDGSGGATGGW